MTEVVSTSIPMAVERALAATTLDEAGRRRVQRRADELEERLTALYEELGAPNPYTAERVAANLAYSYDTATLPTQDDQVRTVVEGFGLAGRLTPKVIQLGSDHPHADGQIILASPTDLGMAFATGAALTKPGYAPTFEHAIRQLKRVRPNFVNHRQGALTADHLELTPGGIARWKRLERLVAPEPGQLRLYSLPVSTGRHYQGLSPRNADFDASEFGHLPGDPLMGVSVLLAWPKRLTNDTETVMDLPCARYSPYADGDFGCALWFLCCGGASGLDRCWAGFGYESCGSLVAFLPE